MNAAMDELVARARRQLDSLHDVNERLAAISGEGQAAGGAVCARADGIGALISLQLTAAVGRMSAADLGNAVVTAAAAAAAEAYRQRVAVMDEFTRSFTELVSAPVEGTD